MEKQIDWNVTKTRARRMTADQLNYAITDCGECVRLKINEGYYADEASVYFSESARREKIGKRNGNA